MGSHPTHGLCSLREPHRLQSQQLQRWFALRFGMAAFRDLLHHSIPPASFPSDCWSKLRFDCCRLLWVQRGETSGQPTGPGATLSPRGHRCCLGCTALGRRKVGNNSQLSQQQLLLYLPTSAPLTEQGKEANSFSCLSWVSRWQDRFVLMTLTYMCSSCLSTA